MRIRDRKKDDGSMWSNGSRMSRENGSSFSAGEMSARRVEMPYGFFDDSKMIDNYPRREKNGYSAHAANVRGSANNNAANRGDSVHDKTEVISRGRKSRIVGKKKTSATDGQDNNEKMAADSSETLGIKDSGASPEGISDGENSESQEKTAETPDSSYVSVGTLHVVDVDEFARDETTPGDAKTEDAVKNTAPENTLSENAPQKNDSGDADSLDKNNDIKVSEIENSSVVEDGPGSSSFSGDEIMLPAEPLVHSNQKNAPQEDYQENIIEKFPGEDAFSEKDNPGDIADSEDADSQKDSGDSFEDRDTSGDSSDSGTSDSQETRRKKKKKR